MCQNQKEQQRWIQDLNKVHKQLKKLEPQFPLPFRFYEIYDSGKIFISFCIFVQTSVFDYLPVKNLQKPYFWLNNSFVQK